MVDPIDYTAGLDRSIANGARLGGLMGVANQQELENQKAAAAKERQDSAYAALQNAKPEDLPALRRQYPEFADLIQKEIGVQDAEHATFVNKALNKISVAAATGNPAMIQTAIEQNKPALMSFGVDPQEAIQMAQNDPQQFGSLLKASMYATMPFEKQIDAGQKQQQLDETGRSNRASEANTVRGQNLAAENSRRSAGGSVPSSVREYEYVKNLSPEEKKNFLRYTNKGGGAGNLQSAQLASGETVMIDPKPLGAGSTKFYKGYDANGQVITVPVTALATSADSSAQAGQNLVNSDISNILNADPKKLDILTGVTGSTGSPALGADIRSRMSDSDTRKLYSSINRMQGNMQNQGIAAARSMGASGINTVAEAKMYFQSMPQLDFSSNESLLDSVRAINDYTQTVNSKNQVSYSGGQQSGQPQTQQQQQPQFNSLWGG